MIEDNNMYTYYNFVLENLEQFMKNIRNMLLEFEIENAQVSNEHVENFAREKLNLSYPDEEFISFEDQKSIKDEK
mgnify:CR=1 FL=1